MPRHFATGLTLLWAVAVLAAAPAHAVIMGNSSSLGSYTVRLVGSSYCTGVAIARSAVVTAAHCAHGMRVMAGVGALRVIGVARSALLDDGRRVRVSGDAAILQLADPLPSGVGPAPIGEGHGDSYHRRLQHHRRARPRRLRCAARGKRGFGRRARWSIRTARARSARAPVSAIPADRCCAAARSSASSRGPPIRRRASPAAISRAGRQSR